jgi:hypothetical protein
MNNKEPAEPVRPSHPEGNEPAPLILFGIALIPILAVAGWMLGVFG